MLGDRSLTSPEFLVLCPESDVEKHCVITARVRSTTEGYAFTGVCLLTGGTPSPSHNTSTDPMPFLEVTHPYPTILPIIGPMSFT